MSEIITIRIPKELKEKLKAYKINVSAEVRKYLEERVKALELQQLIERIEREAKLRKVSEDSVRLIREDRER